MDLRRYGMGLRLVVKACTLLSRWPDLVTANSVAGLKSHLALGYRPRRTEVVPTGLTSRSSSRTQPRAARCEPSSAFPTMQPCLLMSRVSTR
jgi:hypothetical protein